MSTVTVVAGDTTTETEFYVTVESQDLFARCFPLIVQQFEQDIATKHKGTANAKVLFYMICILLLSLKWSPLFSQSSSVECQLSLFYCRMFI